MIGTEFAFTLDHAGVRLRGQVEEIRDVVAALRWRGARVRKSRALVAGKHAP